jgi:sulfite reductase alpha subunit-like flavoprotein
MQKAWKFLLRADLPPNSLQTLRFTCFGLGDSSYPLFNAMAKKLTQRLINLGATLVGKVGLGDYQHDFGYEGEFDYWLQSLWPNLSALLPHVKEPAQVPGLLPPVYKIQKAEEPANDCLPHLPAPHSALSSVQFCKLLRNDRITSANHFQDTRHLELTFT